MAVGRCTDEIIIADLHLLPQLDENRHVFFHQLRCRCPLRLGGLDHLDAMFIRTGQKPGILTLEPMIARNRIGADRRVNMPQVRFGIGIVDRSGNIKSLSH